MTGASKTSRRNRSSQPAQELRQHHHLPNAGRRLVNRAFNGPVRAQKTETSNKESKDITETGGKVNYDKCAIEVDQLQPAFTRRQEMFVGWLAMVGSVSAVLSELITGRGELGQGGLYTGLSRPAVQALVFGIVSCNYLAAVNPSVDYY